MKQLPTVIASPERGIGMEVLEFQGAEKIRDRDATGFYYGVRLAPQADVSRIAVLFSGTVFYVRPDFGLPDIEDRTELFAIYAEAVIGDFLSENGLPNPAPSGVAPFQIECFSPRFQMWEDRRPASDDEIEAYLRTHVFWSWQFGHPAWELGLSDRLRLRQTLPMIERLVSLNAGQEWSVAPRLPHSFSLTPSPDFIRRHRKGLAPSALVNPSVDKDEVATNTPAEYVYVDEARIADLRNINSSDFDLRKVIVFCEELNICYRSQCYHAVTALTRSLIDHVPPLLGCRTFAEVASSYDGGRSFKECALRLEEAARKIGDMHLHTPVRKRESLPSRTQVNFSNEVDVLLAEIVRKLRESKA